MKAMSVIEIANLYGMNRQSIYKRIKKGDLSKNSDGRIDLSEAIRVFGEPAQRKSNPDGAQLHYPQLQKLAEVDILKQQVDILRKQLELAQERESFQRQQLQVKDDQIFSLQLLLGVPKQQVEVEQGKEPEQEIAVEKSQEEVSIPKVEIQQPVKRRSLFGRVINAILD
ncbi:plasmid replication DNA-binding protein [Acinetobacter radioresistens]|uniref:plasmid replication DNA-binding protein n=1 Tax=Acinetobacter radioresistens TaxID=40216 RepID=UPI000619D785|nr:plasmid replication DNA-binding protein [Acinetobacter radioresistens]